MPSSDRGRLWRWKWNILGLGILALVTVLWLRQGPVSQIEALRAQGDPVSLADLERRLGPDAPLGRTNALKLVQIVEAQRRDKKRPIPPRSKSVTAEDRAWAEGQLGSENAGDWNQLHALLRTGPWCFADYSGGVFNPNTDALGGVKGVAVALQAEAVAAAILGDSTRAGQALNEAVRVGRLVDSGGVLIDYLVRIACDAIAARAAESVFTRVQLDDASLVSLQRGFRAAEGTNALAQALVGERAFGITGFQMSPSQLAATANAAAGLPPTPTPSSAAQDLMSIPYRVFLLRPDQRFYLEQMALLIRAAESPGPEGEKQVHELEESLRRDRFPFLRVLSRMALPNLYKSVAKEARHVTTMRCAQAACAIERYQLKHQTLPPTLEALVPEYLDAVPEDPLTGGPLKYRIRGEGYVVYGIGEDGTDDGGQEPQKKPQGWDYTFRVE